MYIITGEGLGQAPDCLSEFLAKVRGRPDNYKKLLLLARLHPYPTNSDYIIQYRTGIQYQTGQVSFTHLIDCVVSTGSSLDKAIEELRPISLANLKNEIDAEEQLWARVVEAIKKVDRSKAKKFLIEPEQLVLLEPALLDPRKLDNIRFLEVSDVRKLQKIGETFARRFLREFRDIRNSNAAEAHFVKLGRTLTGHAISLQGDPAFKKVVEREREKRRSAEERQIQQNLRYFQKHPIPGLPPFPVTRPPSGSRGRR